MSILSEKVKHYIDSDREELSDSEKLELLPVCVPVFTGHMLRNKEVDMDIHSGDFIKIISPRSRFHNWVVIFERIDDRNIHVQYKTESDVLGYEIIEPAAEFLTWRDFKFKKIRDRRE